MPFAIPSLQDLRTECAGNFAARLPGADTTLRVSFIKVSAYVMAGGIYAGLRALVWLSRQLFVDSAEDPYLDRRLSNYGMTREQAAYAAGPVVFSGTSTVVVPAATVLQSSDSTQQYLVQQNGTIDGSGTGSCTVNVSAVTAGSAGNQVVNAPLTITSAIAGVNPVALVGTGGLVGGLDLESDDSFRARGLARIRQPPQGGAGADFWQWARNSGVPTRAWVYPLRRGAGSVDVTFVIDTRTNPIPLSADITAVQDAIAAVDPVIGDMLVFAPTPDALPITIRGLTPGDSGTQAAVSAALAALVASVPPGGAAYGDGVTEPLQTGALFATQTPGVLYLSMIEAAIESVGTITKYDLVLPAADVTFASGHMPAAPTIVYE